MFRLLLERVDETEKQTIGLLYVLDENNNAVFTCHTVELPYRENANNISCIPKQKYICEQRTSLKYGKHLHITKVPNRTYILIHNANYYTQLRGCVAVGDDWKYINSDNELDVSNSKKTMRKLIDVLGNQNEILLEVI